MRRGTDISIDESTSFIMEKNKRKQPFHDIKTAFI